MRHKMPTVEREQVLEFLGPYVLGPQQNIVITIRLTRLTSLMMSLALDATPIPPT